MIIARSKLFWFCLFAFSAIAFADDFELPDLPEPPQATTEPTSDAIKESATVEELPVKEAVKDASKDASKEVAKDAAKDAPNDVSAKNVPEQSDYDAPVNFAPIEATTLSESKTEQPSSNPPRQQGSKAIVPKKIPEELNRPLQVGVFIGVKELYLKLEGEIIRYEQRNKAVSAEGYSAQTELSMTVNVRFTNNVNHNEDFEQQFTATQSYDSTLSLNSVQEELVSKIIDDICEQIFNACVANW